MKISLNWLKQYLDLDGISEAAILEKLPLIGLEIESVESLGLPPTDNLVVGEILSREPHPNADRLGVCSVAVGESEPLQIVCGATNYQVGDRVPVARVGCVLPGDFTIKKSKLRGVDSHGMMCSAKELGMGDDHSGLMILTQRPEIGASMNTVLGEGDTVIELELTANRGDCLSHIGVARELGAAFGRPLKTPDVPATVGSGKGWLEGVEVTTPNCPFYTAWSLKGVRIGPSPDWLKSALEAVGLRPINNVVDVTNYVLMETGQPLHAFDAAKIRGGQLCVRQALAGERITTLDDVARELTPEMMVIADAERPLVIAGVMGSIDAEVDTQTTDIVLESAWFEPGSVRATTRTLNLFTDSSHRFTRNVDPQGVLKWGRRAIDLIIEVAGGEMVGEAITVGSEPRGPVTIELEPDFVRQRAGFEIADSTLAESFTNLGFELDTTKTPWQVTVPTFRWEVTRPIDLVEECIRLYGTERIPSKPVLATGLHREDDPLAQFNRKAIDALTAQQFVECAHYSLVDHAVLAKWERDGFAEALSLANPLTSEMSHVRASLIPGLLGALARNQSRGVAAPRLCETGRVFRMRDGDVYELAAASFVMAVDAPESAWKTRERPDFYTAKAIALHLAQIAGINVAESALAANDTPPLYQPGHAAMTPCYRENGWMLGVGLVNLNLLKSLEVDGFVVAGELLLQPDWLRQHQDSDVRFEPYTDQPSSRKDLALLVDDSTFAETVRQDIADAADEATGDAFDCESVTVFDTYTDATLEASSKKSLAYALNFRAPDRTLKDKEINRAYDTIRKLLEAKGYTLR